MTGRPLGGERLLDKRIKERPFYPYAWKQKNSEALGGFFHKGKKVSGKVKLFDTVEGLSLDEFYRLSENCFVVRIQATHCF